MRNFVTLEILPSRDYLLYDQNGTIRFETANFNLAMSYLKFAKRTLNYQSLAYNL